MPQESQPWHAMTADQVCSYWEVDPAAGLGSSRSQQRRQRLGDNTLPEGPVPSELLRLLRQFKDPLVFALLVAAGIAAAVAINAPEDSSGSLLTRFGDTAAIVLIVLLNAALGFYQERRAEAALKALRAMASPTARVVSDGSPRIVPARELVPGDIVELEAGDSVAADMRLIDTAELATTEATLTGESTAVNKDPGGMLDADQPLAERSNMVYTGTSVTHGRGRAVVVQTGAYTELGRIGTLVQSASPQSTPLELQLKRLGRWILSGCVGISLLLLVIGTLQGEQSWDLLLLTAVSLAVAAIPEGLPAITTITLALGMQRMAKRGAIVRRLPAVETLGSATVICTDKTGTLTESRMKVRTVALAEGDVTLGDGAPTDPDALGVASAGTEVAPSPGDSSGTLRAILEAITVCNAAKLGEHGPIGDPTEVAMLSAAADAGITRSDMLHGSTIVREIPFNSERKRMTVVMQRADGRRVAYAKGSLDVLLPLCNRERRGDTEHVLDDEARARILARNAALAKQAMRVLAVTMREDPDEDPERDLVMLGLVAMLDPPRPEVKQAIEECRQAGIRVVMITGDHVLTAVAIARELDIWRPGSLAMTGAELDATDGQKLLATIDSIAVFARVTAEQKLRIIRAFNRSGHVTAMTGDGVNDAPALREAPIGTAMGKAGTDVARQAADMVLADDNFATIVEAVREGRAIFGNIQKFIYFLISANAGLVVAVIIASFFDWMPQFTPLQILWINLVTNGLPALALGVDPTTPGLMRAPPRPVGSPVLNLEHGLGVALVGAFMGGAALFMFLLPGLWSALFAGVPHEVALAEARSMAFTMLALSPLFHSLSCRSADRSLFQLGVRQNWLLWGAILVSASLQLMAVLVPPLLPVFATHPLSGGQWLVLLGLAIAVVPFVEILKAVTRLMRRSRDPRIAA